MGNSEAAPCVLFFPLVLLFTHDLLMTNDPKTVWQPCRKWRHRDENKSRFLKQVTRDSGIYAAKTLHTQSSTTDQRHLVSDTHTSLSVQVTVPSLAPRIPAGSGTGLLFPAGRLPFLFIELMSGIAKLHLRPRDTGGDYV